MSDQKTVHWLPGEADEVHRTGRTVACGLTTSEVDWHGLRVTGDTDRATCYRCRRRIAEGPSARSQRPTVTLHLRARSWAPDALPDDGVSRWAVAGGRFWRVWPVAGRGNGWHVEEVTDTGEPAGHPVRAPHGLDWYWTGGFYSRVGTLDDARATIAYLTDEGPARATA